MQDLSANILGEEKDAASFANIPLQCNKSIQQKQKRKATEDILATFGFFTLYLIKITPLGTFCLIYETPLIFLYIWVMFTVLFGSVCCCFKVKCNEKTKRELPIEMYRTELVTQNSCICISFFLQHLFLWDTEQSSG